MAKRDTLAEMQKAGLVDDEEELTIPESEEGLEIETELEIAPDGEGDPVEESEEIDLGDEQDTPEPKRRKKSVKQTLGHLRRQRRELRQDNSHLNAENASLRAEIDALKAATLKKPRYADFGSDEEYEAALLQYHSLVKPGKTEERKPSQEAPASAPDFTDSVNAHYARAEGLGVSLDRFEQAERVVRDALGDVVTDALIDAVGEGSEKAIMAFGSNPAEFDKLKSLLRSDPTGSKAIAHSVRLSERVRVTKPRVSGAAKPTRTPSGGGGVRTGKLEKALEDAEKSGDANAMFKARRALRRAQKEAAASQ